MIRPASGMKFSLQTTKMEGLIYRSRYFRVIATGLIFLINITASFAVNNCADRLIGVENKYIIPDSSFTATSHYDNRYHPYYARLNSNLNGWAPETNTDPDDYLQIDLGLPYVICAVATQGNSLGGEWVEQYNISLSLDDTTWPPYQENGALKLFVGNIDHSTIKKHNLTQPLARYIRFIPTTYHGHKTMRVGIYGFLEACENCPLGMESGAIQDGSITASSAQHPAKNARLHYTSDSSWCASTSDSDPYLQIDLGSSHLICAVATQGNFMADKWVKTYQIDTTTDGTTWTTYQENNTDRIFYGNSDRSTVVRRVLYHGLITRYIRIVPKTYQTDTPCLRTEVYGYPFQTSCSSHSVGIPSTSLVPDHRFTATSHASVFKPSKGRLGAGTAWASRNTNNANDYIQVDLGTVFYVCAVATQGLGENRNEYVKKYEVWYSTNNVNWSTYRTNSGGTEFSGNSDRTTVVTNAITNPFRARFVRVRPTDYQQWKIMRLDFKGLPLGCSSSLGLENSKIPDSQITASAVHQTYTAPHGRLYDSSSWCGDKDPNEYIQVDLGQVKTVTGIATQGTPGFDAWVASYKVRYSFDNTHWNEYKEGQVVKVLDGNINKNGVRVNWLHHPIAARYFRIYPQTHNTGGRHCLRFDLYGCDIFAIPKVILDTTSLILPSNKGSSRTLTCSVLGEPAPDIQWFNNGTKINGATQSTLQVQFISAEDVVSKYICTRQDPNTRAVVCNTFYTCRATYPSYVASGGMADALAKVVVILNVPRAPTVTAQPHKSSITLRWTPMTFSDDVGDIISYTIQLHNHDDSIVTLNAHHPALNYSVENLKPYTNYSIRMNAISTVGQGLWSNWLYASTLITACEKSPLGMESGVIQDGSITASSAQHPAKNARLHYTSGSSWCASTSDSDPYLQIDLGSSHLICAVATQGNFMADQWVKTYQINTSTDGTTWTTYQENNTDRIFYGNYDRSTVVRRVLYHGVITRHLRIVPKTYQTDTPCLRTEIYGYPFETSCSGHSVGIPSTSLVPDHRFTATSHASVYKPSKGRLGADTAWAPSTENTASDYLQVDLGAVFYVCAVATQGLGENRNIEYVKKYEVLYSINNVQWTTYHNNSGGTEFSGNSDRTTVVTNAITNPFRARFVRVRPTDYERWKFLRLDFKGLPLGCSSSLGLENSRIPDSQITASAEYRIYTAPHGRLYDSSSWCGYTVSNEYIQVDLGQVKTVTGIATQGSLVKGLWVTSYKVSYSFDNTKWTNYTEILDGNTNRNGVRVNWLRHPVAARYVRIYPQTQHAGNCLRLDLYGCDIFVNASDVILPSIKGSSRTLTCSVLGEPAPDIQWFNNGTKINGATQSTLQVQFISAEDVVTKYNCTRQDPNTRAVSCHTFYTCKIVNPFHLPSEGMKETTLVKVAVFLNVPKAPNVTVKPNNESIILSWTAMTLSDDVGNLTTYTIQLHNQSGSTSTYEAHHPALNYSVDNLKPYTSYSIRMNAKSVVGQGLWSIWLDVRTLIAEPEGVPTIIGTYVLSSQSIELHFQYSQLDLLYGPMAGFRIFYTPKGRSQQHIDVGNVNKKTLTNLKKYTEYSLSVAVRNTMYVGPESIIMRNKTLEDAPDAEPQNTTSRKINETTFLVTWQPLSTAQSNGVVTKYEIFWSLDLSGRRSRRSLPEMLNATTQATQYTLYNLRVCANYVVSVRAYTSVGPGPKSTINILTSRAQSGMPTGILTENQTKTSIKLKWEKPLPLSLAVDEYVIEVKGSKSYWPEYSFSKTYTQNGAQTNMVIDGLVPGTSYEFWVTASTVCGKSEKSAPTRRDTDIDNPVKPKGNSVTLKDKFNVPLWQVDPINGPISSYQVIVIKGKKDVSNLPANISDYKDGRDIYITAELKPNEFKSSFAVGDNEKFGKYKNVQLDKGKSYTIAERAITEHQGKIYAGQAAVVATVEVTQDPIEYSNSTIWALEGDKITVGCYASGHEPIKYFWTKAGFLLEADNPAVKIRGNNLIIRLKSDKEFGTYICTATNSEQTIVHSINRVELKKYTTPKSDTSIKGECKAKQVVPYVIPLALIILGLVICIVYLVYRLLRKEKQKDKKKTKSKTYETGNTNEVMDNSNYEDNIIKNPRKPRTTKNNEIETPSYMELQPTQSGDTVYQSIKEPANRHGKITPHTHAQGMTGHQIYTDLKPRVNTEYERLHYKKNAQGQNYENVSQSLSQNISSHATEA